MKILAILIGLFLTSNLDTQGSNLTEVETLNPSSCKIDTTLNNFHIHLTMNDRKMTKGVANFVNLSIENIDNNDIAIFTKITEATVRIGEKKGDYKVTPTKTTETVSINISIKQINGQRKTVGEIVLKTK